MPLVGRILELVALFIEPEQYMVYYHLGLSLFASI